MCGRDYLTYTDEELFFRYLNRKTWPWAIEKDIPAFKPNYNMCPTQTGPVLSVVDGKLGFRLMRWGLVPAWAKTVKDADKYSMINAKSEEIAEKRSYKAAFQKRRCIVPVSGFYEWQRSGTTKKPFAIHLKNAPIMSLAGIWEHWVNIEDTETVDSFALITTAANSYMEKIHTRMPVILGPQEEERWLDPNLNDGSQLSSFMKGCPPEWLESYEISPLVNSPKNNSVEVLKALQS